MPDVVRHHGWEMKLDMHSFFPKWNKVVGKQVSECSRPLKIVKNILWLEVENSAWMQQLQFEKAQILEDINKTLKISRIRDIKFILPDESDKVEPQEQKLTFVSPDPLDLHAFEKQAAIIEDEEARDALVRLWYLSKACRKDEK